jgi:aspartyl protease family protein
MIAWRLGRADLPDHDGPWGGPQQPAPPPQPAARRRAPLGVILWVALMVVAGAGFWGFTRLFPGQLDGADKQQAFYSLGLLGVVSSGLVYARQVNVGRTVRYMAIWVAIAAMAVTGFTFRDDLAAAALRVRGALIPAYAVSTSPHEMVIARSEDGGFYVMGQVNGMPVRFLLDTGSGETTLSPADAQRLGIDPATLTFSRTTETANGVGHGAPYTAAGLTVGQIHLTQVAMDINQAPMSTSLLGMSFFKRLDSVEIRGDQLFLHWRG